MALGEPCTPLASWVIGGGMRELVPDTAPQCWDGPGSDCSTSSPRTATSRALYLPMKTLSLKDAPTQI